MRRREFLGLAALPLAQALNRQPVRSLRGRVIGLDGTNAAGVALTQDWQLKKKPRRAQRSQRRLDSAISAFSAVPSVRR